MSTWHIVTGEYPPGGGGVADYTQRLARALAAAGDEVHVWAPAPRGPLAEEPGFTVHALPGLFGPRSFVTLAKGVERGPGPRRILLQYVPQAYGLRGLNLPFCAALALRPGELWVMFHEVMVLVDGKRTLPRYVFSGVTHAMAAVLAYRADRLFVSCSAWIDLMRTHLPGLAPPTCIPIPSNISAAAAPERVRAIRSELSQEGKWDLVGHFGTYGAMVAPLVEHVFVSLFARHPRARAVLLGRGGPAFAEMLASKHPDAEGRAIALGELSDDEAAAHLAALDLAVQPYPDGISTRRTSAMASLALGVPLVTNEGRLSEPLWREEQGAAVVSDGASLEECASSMAERARELLNDKASARAQGERGRRLYERSFSLEQTVRALRAQKREDHVGR